MKALFSRLFISLVTLTLFIGTITVGAVAADNDAVTVTDEATLASALESGGSIKLGCDVVIFDMLTVPKDADVSLDLCGYTLSTDDERNTYALNNLGNLVILDSIGAGAISSRGIYNGYDEGGAHVTEASLHILSGEFNAMGTNGGSAITSYAILTVDGGKFTSVGGYSISTKDGSVSVINFATVTGGIHNLGLLTVNGGEISNTRLNSYAVYNYNGDLTVNGGTFYNKNANNATVSNSGSARANITDGVFSNGKTQYILDGKGFTVSGGRFNGGIRSTDIAISGGEFNNASGIGYRVSSGKVSGGSFEDAASVNMASANLAEGCILKEIGSGAVVIDCEREVLEGAKYNLTTMTSFIGNFYLEIPDEDSYYTLDAESIDTYVGVASIGGVDYYRFTAAPTVSDITSDIVFEITADFDGKEVSLTAAFTTDSYFKDVMSRYSMIAEPTESEIEDMALIMNAARYANELYKYSNSDGEGYPEYEELLSNEAYGKYLISLTEDDIKEDADKDISELSDVFDSARLRIVAGYSASFAFCTCEAVDLSALAGVSISYVGINGDEVVKELDYNEESRMYSVGEMPIYDMLETLTVYVEFTSGEVSSGRYNLAAYVSGSDADIAPAIYAYAMASRAYKIDQ